MEYKIKITCPECNFFKVFPEDLLPNGAKTLTCPKCNKTFPLTADSIAVHCEPDPPASVTNPPASAVPPPLPDSTDTAAQILPPPLPQTGQQPEPGETSSQQAATPPPIPVTGQPEGQTPGNPQTLNFDFKGTAKEYFGIWIVNTLLQIITCGIYSPWAKVRRRRFFYASTLLHNEPFDYLADPLVLFKGWLIGAVMLILYSVSNQISPFLSMAIGMIIFVAIPWLIVRSKVFNNSNSAHRNIRFGFKPNYHESYAVFMGLPMLVPITLGAAAPYVKYSQIKFLVENTLYGSTPFTFTAKAKDFYKLYIKVFGGFLALFIITIAFGSMLDLSSFFSKKATEISDMPGLFFPLMIFVVISYYLLIVYLTTELTNLTWNKTTITGNSFKSVQNPFKVAWLLFTNLLAITLTCGLLTPWATVRMTRYRLECLSLETTNGISSFTCGDQNYTTTATGEEISDVFGIDIGL